MHGTTGGFYGDSKKVSVFAAVDFILINGTFFKSLSFFGSRLNKRQFISINCGDSWISGHFFAIELHLSFSKEINS